MLERVISSTPAFFERLIVELLLAMGYGGARADAGRVIGKSGDDGVDGVIDQDILGVDQIYIQAKRYDRDNKISAAAIREFSGALSMKQVNRGIFVTTSSFTSSAKGTAELLRERIVLIDGQQLSRLMIKHSVGCRQSDVLVINKIDEDFFDIGL